MLNKSLQQTGSVLIFVVILLVVIIAGILGFVAWNSSYAPKTEDTNTNGTANTKGEPQTEAIYRTVKISDRNFKYPVNENNQKVIIISDKSTPTLQVSYAPIRNYYLDKNVNDDCKSYTAGFVTASTEKEITVYSLLSRFYGKETLKGALSDGTVVQVGEQDIYLLGPVKQNEPCEDINSSKDPVLVNVLAEVKGIRLNWLKSLVLVE